MIVREAGIGSLRVKEMDIDGFTVVRGTDMVWISHEQLDDLVQLAAAVRGVNAATQRPSASP